MTVYIGCYTEVYAVWQQVKGSEIAITPLALHNFHDSIQGCYTQVYGSRLREVAVLHGKGVDVLPDWTKLYRFGLSRRLTPLGIMWGQLTPPKKTLDTIVL